MKACCTLQSPISHSEGLHNHEAEEDPFSHSLQVPPSFLPFSFSPPSPLSFPIPCQCSIWCAPCTTSSTTSTPSIFLSPLLLPPLPLFPHPLPPPLTAHPAKCASLSFFRTSNGCSDPKQKKCSRPLLGWFLLPLSGPAPGFSWKVFGSFPWLFLIHFDFLRILVSTLLKAPLLLAAAAADAAVVAIEILLVSPCFPLCSWANHLRFTYTVA